MDMDVLQRVLNGVAGKWKEKNYIANRISPVIKIHLSHSSKQAVRDDVPTERYTVLADCSVRHDKY
jgi:hypothetical protein